MAHTISQCLLGACLCSQFCLDELRLLANILLSSRTPENWKCWVLHTYYITCMTKNALSLTTTDYCVTLVQSSELNLLFLIVLLCIAFINHKSDKLPVTVLQLYIYLNCLIHCPHLTRHRPLMWHGPEHFRGGQAGRKLWSQTIQNKYRVCIMFCARTRCSSSSSRSPIIFLLDSPLFNK